MTIYILSFIVQTHLIKKSVEIRLSEYVRSSTMVTSIKPQFKAYHNSNSYIFLKPVCTSNYQEKRSLQNFQKIIKNRNYILIYGVTTRILPPISKGLRRSKTISFMPSASIISLTPLKRLLIKTRVLLFF